ncbi:hypothetical protein [Haladaptatus sp. DFWS20]|uniref:DUF7847 domain-containing protein n=1 Tax=Haladaptatus sp. DFWS20 TaxID=3403467 RepID=UPI003EB717ED
MAVVNALRTAGRTVLRNPIILLATALLGVVQLPQLLAQSINSVLVGLFSLVLSLLLLFVTPFFQAGLIGMANEAIDGRTRFGTLVSEGKDHYVPVFGVYLLIMAVSIAVGIGVAVAAFAGIGTVLATGGEPSVTMLAVFRRRHSFYPPVLTGA